jgi:aspartyl-tRNA(Asn)/glutamyl-tRNA(Gln) amidotransferase subunit A
MTVREIGALFRTRKISCLEFVRKTLDDVANRDRSNCFITLTPEHALAEAAERDAELARGLDRGPFHGVPIAHKDIIHTAGVPTTGASRLYRDFIPTTDADVVVRLKEAGAISIGKTNLHELAYGATSQSSYFGPVLNPLDPTRIPGGSSGGSAAAVAAGFVPMATGSDTGGSIRIPASYCGTAGFKPTYDLVSRRGVMPLSYSLDHIGPLGTTVEDCALAMAAIGGLEPASAELKGLRVCLPANFFFERVDSEVASAVRQAAAVMERQGAILSEARIPDLHEANLAARIVQMSESASIYAHLQDPTLVGEGFWALIQQGKGIAGHEYVSAQRIRTIFRRDFNRFWTGYDVIVAPATPVVAPRRNQDSVLIGTEEESTRMASTRLTRPVNFLGEPAISIPCGRNKDGMPIGLQLIAAPRRDAHLLSIAKLVEDLLAFDRQS